jgi:hypothetical protein
MKKKANAQMRKAREKSGHKKETLGRNQTGMKIEQKIKEKKEQ